MSDIAIRVEGLGKRYRIGTRGQRYGSLRDSVAETFAKPLRAARSLMSSNGNGRAESGSLPFEISPSPNDFWALQDISFEVKPGEVVGIIGRNGAGKSTLLKVLSRITEPTVGEVDIYGRVSSLLEVGTGFHPELTGRENIFLNGAILGMHRSEITRKFDEIVAFAEIEKFIDTTVKHYSSGMYLRLAFAVAAHLEPEILIVDEVLAVGDASFQRKCMNQMQVVGEQGRTVLLVSHNMPAITRLCHRALLVDGGQIARDAPSHQVVSEYLSSGLRTTAAREWEDLTKAPGNDIARLRAVRVRTKDRRIAEAIDIRQPVGIEMEFEVLQQGHVLVPNYHFINEEGVSAFVASDHDPAWWRKPRPVGRYKSTAWIPGNYLSEGPLVVGAAVSTMNPVMIHFWERDAVAFQVIDSLDGDSARGDYAGAMPGVVRPMLQWETQFSPNGHYASQVLVAGERR